MITYEFECPVHKRFSAVFAFGDLPLSAPCPVMLYEGDEGDDGEIQPESEVLCNEDSPRVLSLPSAVIIKRDSGYHPKPVPKRR